MESGRERKVSFMKVCLFFKKYEGKVFYKPFFIFFVYPLWGPFPIGKSAKQKWHFPFIYIHRHQSEGFTNFINNILYCNQTKCS